MAKKNFAWLMVMSIGLAACQKEFRQQQDELLRSPGAAVLAHASGDHVNTFYGPQVQMGKGHIRSWVTITHEGKPTDIGVEMTAGALEGLPSTIGDHHEGEYVLALHPKAKAATTFDHIGFNWNPGGHPPPRVYTVPHFDIHFYIMPLAERMMIPAYADDPSGFDNWPAPGYIPYKTPALPPNDPTRPYFNAGGGEAMMGTHWVSLHAPEFNGQPFTHTFIYGSYEGKVTFYEPMITLAYLKSKVTTGTNHPFVTPTMFSPSDEWYPSAYNIWYNSTKDRYYISLSGFMWR